MRIKPEHLTMLSRPCAVAYRYRRYIRIPAAAALVTVVAAVAGPALAGPATGWRIVHEDHSKADVLVTVAAISPHDAWAAGNGPGRSATAPAPLIEHWNGRNWSDSKLPGGLSGFVKSLRASSWRNVWAFGDQANNGPAFALRWNGHRWSVAKRWSIAVLSEVADAAVFGPGDVWLFSQGENVIEHFDGHVWHTIRVAGMFFFDSVSAVSPRDIWAVGADQAGFSAVAHGTAHGTGIAWHVTELPGLPASPSGDLLTDVNARAAHDVWLFGGNVAHQHWFPLMEHWNGRRWRRVNVTGAFTLAGGASVSDGRGGFWLTTGWDGTGVPPHLLDFNSGKFTRVRLPRPDKRFVGVFGLARIPGSSSVWGVGGLTGLGNLGPTTGVILRDGR